MGGSRKMAGSPMPGTVKDNGIHPARVVIYGKSIGTDTCPKDGVIIPKVLSAEPE